MKVRLWVRNARLSQRVAELSSRADVELREHLSQVPLDGARADEHLRADLRVRVTVSSKTRAVRFLRGELVEGRSGALANGFARGEQLCPSPLGEAVDPHRAEHLVGDVQLVSRVPPAVPAA